MKDFAASQRIIGVVCIFTTCCLWGVLPFFLEASLNYSDVLSIAWFRFMLAFLTLFFFLAGRRRLEKSRKSLPAMLAAGFLLAINYVGFMKGLEHTSPANAQVLIQFAPILFAIFGTLLFRERLTKRQWLGLGLACFGFAFFYSQQLENLLVSAGEYVKGNLFILIGALSWAVYALFNKSAVQGRSPQEVSMYVYGVAALVLFPTADLSSFVEFSWQVWLLFGFLAFNTIVAYGCLSEAMKRLKSATVSVVIILNPLITIAVIYLSNLFQLDLDMEKPLSLLTLLGALAILMGAILVVLGKPNVKKV